jgi:hypothetical protein
MQGLLGIRAGHVLRTVSMLETTAPFRFLKERVWPDLEAWAPPRVRGASHGSAVCQPIWEPRLLVPSLCEGELEDALDGAFDASTAAHRGLAWVRITGWVDSSPDSRIKLTSSLSNRLGSRFPILHGHADSALVDAWLNSLEALVRRRLREHNLNYFRKERFSNLAGQEAAVLRGDMARAHGSLSDPDANKREAAILALHQSASPKEPLIARFRDLVTRDPDLSVRITALSSCIKICTRTKDAAILNMLAAIVADKSLPDMLRDVAYQGLFQVCDAPVAEWPVTRWAAGRFRFPDDIDWEFVRRHVQEK